MVDLSSSLCKRLPEGMAYHQLWHIKTHGGFSQVKHADYSKVFAAWTRRTLAKKKRCSDATHVGFRRGKSGKTGC
jgi:hypothetical protein